MKCKLCEKGFVMVNGFHVGNQSLGMIPTTKCEAMVKAGRPQKWHEPMTRVYIPTRLVPMFRAWLVKQMKKKVRL